VSAGATAAGLYDISRVEADDDELWRRRFVSRCINHKRSRCSLKRNINQLTKITLHNIGYYRCETLFNEKYIIYTECVNNNRATARNVTVIILVEIVRKKD